MIQQTILWFRVDLRLSDNPALKKAVDLNLPVLPIFIYDEEDAQRRSLGAASKWWLHKSLKNLSNELELVGSKLLIFKGKAEEILQKLIYNTKVTNVLWNRRY